MNYHIPSDQQIQKALRKIFKKYRIVQTQHKLKKLVTGELSTKKKKFGVSQKRLRNIAINSNFVNVEINTREGNPKRFLANCPVCNDNLAKVKNFTIWGGEVTIEYRCNRCGYWTGKKKRIPTRYVFHSK